MISVNGTSEDYVEETLAELLTRKGLQTRGIAVAVNGDVVPRSQWSKTIVRDASQVEIVTAAAGG